MEQEVRELFREEVLLASRLVHVTSRSVSGITVKIAPDKSLNSSPDPFRRCAASIQGTVTLDPASFHRARLRRRDQIRA